MAGSYMDQIASLPGDAAASAHSLAGEIARRVQRYRESKLEIEELRTSSGVSELELGLEVQKTELLPLAQQYREFVGSNWKDESGFCHYAEPGERRSWDADRLDQILATLITLRAEMDGLSNDAPLSLVTSAGAMTVSQIKAANGEGFEREELISLLEQLNAIHQTTIQEMIFRLSRMSETLDLFAAARSVSPVKESVRIR